MVPAERTCPVGSRSSEREQLRIRHRVFQRRWLSAIRTVEGLLPFGLAATATRFGSPKDFALTGGAAPAHFNMKDGQRGLQSGR
jgi:hypothetical protein